MRADARAGDGGVRDKRRDRQRQTIMQIVPRADELVVEGQGRSQRHRPGRRQCGGGRAHLGRQSAHDAGDATSRACRPTSREQRQNSAQPAQAYYTVRTVLPAEEVARLRDIHLLPGMPVEVFIQTHERSPLQCLLTPDVSRAMRTAAELTDRPSLARRLIHTAALQLRMCLKTAQHHWARALRRTAAAGP